MKFERIRSVDYYCCPVCGMAFTDRKEAERHFRYDHQIEICKVIRCNICGAGWDTKVYGEQEARRRADQCCQSHIDDGSAEAIARRNYFFTDGEIGYLRSVKGEREDK